MTEQRRREIVAEMAKNCGYKTSAKETIDIPLSNEAWRAEQAREINAMLATLATPTEPMDERRRKEIVGEVVKNSGNYVASNGKGNDNPIEAFLSALDGEQKQIFEDGIRRAIRHDNLKNFIESVVALCYDPITDMLDGKTDKFQEMQPSFM